MTFSAGSERAAQIPSGMPNIRAMMTETAMIASVIIAWSQLAIIPTPAIAAAPPSAARTPPVRHPTAPVRATTPGQRIELSSDVT